MTESGTPESAAGDDPDAPWRRDYTGPEPTPPAPAWAEPTTAPVSPPGPPSLDPWSREADEITDDERPAAETGGGERLPIDPEEAERAHRVAAEEAPSSDGPGLVGLVGLLVVAGLVVAGLVAVALLDRDDEEAALPTIPESVDERWSIEIDSRTTPVLVDGQVVVAETDRLLALDARTGEERWSRDAGDVAFVELQAVDDIVVVTERTGDSTTVRAVATDDGEPRWSRRVAENRSVMAFAGELFEIEFEDDDTTIALLDPATGLPGTERFTDAGLSIPPPVLSVLEADDEVGFVDIRSGERVGHVVDAAGLRYATVVDDRVIALTDDRTIAVIADDGSIVDDIAVPSGPDRSEDILLVVPGTDQVVTFADGSTVAFDIDADELSVAWSLPGEPRVANTTDVGTVVVVAPVDLGGAARVVDPVSGDVLFEFDHDPSPFPDSGTFELARNGLVYAEDDRVRALALDGTERWSVSGSSEWFDVDDVLVVNRGDVITVYG